MTADWGLWSDFLASAHLLGLATSTDWKTGGKGSVSRWFVWLFPPLLSSLVCWLTVMYLFLSCFIVSWQQLYFWLCMIACVHADMETDPFWVDDCIYGKKKPKQLYYCFLHVKNCSSCYFLMLIQRTTAPIRCSFLKTSAPMTHLLQVMLVDGFKGQKVQDVKKLIQKVMVDNVCDRVHTATSKSPVLSFSP